MATTTTTSSSTSTSTTTTFPPQVYIKKGPHRLEFWVGDVEVVRFNVDGSIDLNKNKNENVF